MAEIRLARFPVLPGVILLREVVGAADDVQVVIRAVGSDGLQQVTELGDREVIGRLLLLQRRHASPF